jgi:hypothetical protein
VSTAELVAGQCGLVFAIFKEPVHRVLADLGVVAPSDPIARDARTIAFLRRLELDPVEILGEAIVAGAEGHVPLGRQTGRRWFLPIGSQSLLTVQ